MIRKATPADEAAATAVLMLAFGADPVARWCWPDPRAFLEHFPAIVKAFGGRAFAEGTAHVIDGGRGAVLWLPPGVGPDEETMGALLNNTPPPSVRDDIPALMEQMGRYHVTEPHWYLPLIGVDPALQNQGHGAALMRPALAICDRERRLAYLEANSPRHVPFYERLGFEVLGKIQTRTSPPLFPMLRKPGARAG